ncbi:SDR family oxidoreductase [Mycolicibacterium sp. YH-1]|uniref:SDR family oxidoreductase n=1 Tax=Mycolicibacterium sp. YH-1 TaxID=2908837 RepID=UPI001F4BE4D5|nr:SDR family oxidoreductase [Mycolicibacterium sp. YH-1]UNB52709.1 SDR family oxidoreductase [Mycolicibacterium sp. YH-1]
MPATDRAPVAVITGGGGGIGRAAGLALAAAGHHVVFCGRTAESLQQSIDLAGSGAALVLDVTHEDAVEAGFAEIARRRGRIDVLVNSAGVFGTQKPVTETPLQDWVQTMTVNVTGSFLCAKAAMRIMAAQDPQGGRIINIGSVSAQVPRPHAVPYTASKFAVNGLTRALALEGRDSGIAVGQIDVGNAATTMTSGFESGSLQADGAVRAEPKFDVRHVGSTVAHIAGLPTDVSVPFLTIMATSMPLLGRG